MTVPSVYSEKSLAEFMQAELGKVAVLLAYAAGAADAGSYAEAVNESVLRYGSVLIADCTEILKLRALARVEAWRKACNDLTTVYKFSSDGSSFERETVYRQAVQNLNRALGLAAEYDPGGAYVISISRAVPVNDPYRYTPEDYQTL
ncbi:MAG: hypothetical protein NTW32_19850 [Chloroflexi bacterium]|nr:hypothetical protein [Chloroflexota bacterium]